MEYYSGSGVDLMRKYTNVRMDADALGIWLCLAIIVVVIILVAVSWVVLAEPSDDMNEPNEDTKWTIDISYKFTFRNLPGGWIARESEKEFRVVVNDYDHDKNYNTWSLAAIWDGWFQKENEFRFSLTLKVTGPHQFSVGPDTFIQDIDIGEFSKQSVSFGTKYVYINNPGDYTVKATLKVTATKEHAWINEIRDDVIWSDSKIIKVVE